MSFKLITALTSYSVTLDEAKAHLRELTTDNDAYIYDLIVAAHKKIQEEYDLGINVEVWDMYMDKFPAGEINIWVWPITSVVVNYTDTAGVTQTVSSTNYTTDLAGKPIRIKPNNSYSWPEVKDVANAVQIRFTTGFTSPDIVPGDIKQAILLIITDWFDNREDKGRRFTRVSEMILQKYRYR